MTVEPPGPKPFVMQIDFGDGSVASCSYENSNGTSEDCDVYQSRDGRTQYCFHVYERAGTFTVRVEGAPSHGIYYGDELTTGEIEVTVGEATSSPSPSPLLPSQSPTRRHC